MSAPSEAGEAGFTLAEMLVVLALVSLAATAGALSMAEGRPGRLVAATTDAVAAELARTRIDAIRTGRLARLVFEPGAVRREGAAPVALPEGVTLDLVTAREAAGMPGGAAVAFLPDGRSTGGRIEIAAGAVRRTVMVDWLTGAVREARP
ncbi:GspH/FimT family pseudopilin [Antarcticirhabdus aurantiaca]|uniref:Prepilin-type N-terminal cleavage/methylation domain-containing protein n=1 Tax=Antarcticirhabdus aurantiaca TaxID=2606717 RepID=A0ACD4NM89_9HYPH|nr:GspH/FimT family pseudopilin [Antarcticirhabdus aurantiaca]WAJ27833.1 prepilin-type N-terminal cleavage/methylation domain-containing protein [Jeongeuplla avenae]